jgi:autotransporter-associated beta strand protein
VCNSKSPFHDEFDVQLKILAYDDLTLSGDGNAVYHFSGGIDEVNPGLRITKTGASTILLGGDNQLTGTIEIVFGTLRLTSPKALGRANLIVRQGASLVADVPLELAEGQSISGDGKIDIPLRD